MISNILFKPKAKEDLIGIWLYSFQKWGEEQADAYLDELEHRINQLQDNPRLGRARDEVREGYRSLAINQHVVLYRIDTDAIRIIRVLHE